MKEEATRRKFLKEASLAGIAFVAGGSLVGAVGCKKKTEPTQVQETPCASGHTKVCAYWDDTGFLFVEDPEIAQKMYAFYQTDPGVEPTGNQTKGIQVRWPEPGSPGNHINSLCSC